MSDVFVLGSFVVDLMCRTPHLPKRGETVFGGPFKLGPGGKGSNQAVAASRYGVDVTFLTKLGADEFGALARKTFRGEGFSERYIYESKNHETGAALIMVEDGSAENCITVSVGACNHITEQEVTRAADDIAGAGIFLTQLETNLDATYKGLELAKEHNVPTILNPAPVQKIDTTALEGLDYITPNETEASALVGFEVKTEADAEKAADAFLAMGVKTALITLGEKGVFVKNKDMAKLIPAFNVGGAEDTTGAGDAFNGGFAAALAEGQKLEDAVRFGCAVAGLCVTKVGTAPAMPYREAIDALMAGTWQRDVA